MFHKEASASLVIGTKKKKTAAMDVPLKKSVRKQLYQRAMSYFGVNEEQKGSSLERLLHNVFLQGNLSSRIIPLERKQWNMVLYIKPPTNEQNDSSTGNDCVWPYRKSLQFAWMSMEEKNRVVDESPTVAFWAVLANYIPIKDMIDQHVVQVPSPVSKYVCRGADLMRAGMRSMPSLKNKSTVAIMVQGNPQPFAVGKIVKPQEEIGINTKGVGVEVWNSYGDDLWKQTFPKSNNNMASNELIMNQIGGGVPFENGDYGNTRFYQGKFVYPLNGNQDQEDLSECSDGEESSPGVTKVVGDNGQNEGSQVVDQLDVPALENETSPIVTNNTIPCAEEEEEASHDKLLHDAVCQALVNLSNKDFPMLLSTFYAQHVLSSTDSNIDMKQTTYKKFGKYVKIQVDRELLLVGRDSKNKKNTDPMAMLIGYRKQHDDLASFSKSTASTVSQSVTSTKLVLVSLYKIPLHWVQLLRLDSDDVKAVNASSEERKGTGMLTSAEVKQILEAYLARESLVNPARKDQILLDGPLTHALFAPKKNQAAFSPPDILSRKDLVKQFTAKLQPAYALVEMPGSKITILRAGSPPKVEIEVSMRQSKKFVTRVRGLEEYGIDGPTFSKDVSKRLAMSATVDYEANAGRPALKKGCVELVFQGNIVDELEALLTGDESLSNHGGVKNSNYSIPLKVLNIVLRKGVPARKNHNRRGGKKNK